MERQPLHSSSISKPSDKIHYQALEISDPINDDKTHYSEEDGSEDSKCTVFETSCNLAKVITGSGMLSLPFAIASTGWLSLGILVALGMIFSYAFDLLVHAIEAYKRRPEYEPGSVINYVVLGKHCFGNHGDTFVLAIFSTELVLALMSFFMNIAINMEVLSSFVSYEAGICIACVLNIVLCSLELKFAAYASAIGSFMIVFVLVALIWCGEEMEHERSEYLAREYSFFHGSGLPLSAGLIAFCFGGHSTFPKLYTAMKEPTRYREVIWNALSGVIVLYVTFASVGYAAYAQYTKAPVTLNIGRDTQDQLFADGVYLRITAAIGVVCNLLVTCPLVTLPVTDTLNLLCRRSETPSSSLAATNKAFIQSNNNANNRNNSGTASSTVINTNARNENAANKIAVVTTSAGISMTAALLALSLGKTQFASACGLIGAVASFSDSLLLPVAFYHLLVDGDEEVEVDDEVTDEVAAAGQINDKCSGIENDGRPSNSSSKNKGRQGRRNKRRRHSNAVIVGHAVITLIGVVCFISGISSTVCRSLNDTHGLCDYFNGQ